MTDTKAPAVLDEVRKQMLEHAWRYFALHAQQRMSIFNFFLLLSGVVSAGMATAYRGEKSLAVPGAMLGALLALTAFVFWQLDSRTSCLIKSAEKALEELEEGFPAISARLVSNDAHRPRKKGLATPWSYGKAFRFVYVTMAFVGIAGATVLLARAR